MRFRIWSLSYRKKVNLLRRYIENKVTKTEGNVTFQRGLKSESPGINYKRYFYTLTFKAKNFECVHDIEKLPGVLTEAMDGIINHLKSYLAKAYGSPFYNGDIFHVTSDESKDGLIYHLSFLLDYDVRQDNVKQLNKFLDVYSDLFSFLNGPNDRRFGLPFISETIVDKNFDPKVSSIVLSKFDTVHENLYKRLGSLIWENNIRIGITVEYIEASSSLVNTLSKEWTLHERDVIIKRMRKKKIVERL